MRKKHLSFALALSSFAVQAQVPIIVERPTSQAVAEGGTAVFNLAVESELPVTYTWHRNFEQTNFYQETLWSTNCTLVFTNVTPKDACFFGIDVHNQHGYAGGIQVMLGVISAGMETNGFALTLYALTNSTWQVNYKTNAASTDWMTLTNLDVPRISVIKFVDTEATNLHRFYQLVPTVY